MTCLQARGRRTLRIGAASGLALPGTGAPSRMRRDPEIGGARPSLSVVPPEGCPVRRIWEIEPELLHVVLGMLLGSEDLGALLASCDGDAREGLRVDLLYRDALARCAVPCAFADAIERHLDREAASVRGRLAGSSLAELAAHWSAERGVASGRDLASLLWTLACDRRREIAVLAERVCGELRLEALRALGARAGREGHG